MSTIPNSHKSNFLNYRIITHVGLVLFLFLVLFIKNAPMFLAGQFVAEDSFYFYETAYNLPWYASVCTPYAGYLHVLPMLLAELLWNLPFSVLPWCNHLVALALCAIMMSWLYVPYCRNLIESDSVRGACTVVLALTPFQPNLGMMLGLHWYLAFMVGLVLLGNLPSGRYSVWGLSFVVIIAAWSSPAAVALVPIALVRWWLLRKQGQRIVPMSFALASIAYAVAIMLVFKPLSAQPGYADMAVAVQGAWVMLTEGVLLQSILGVGVGTLLPEWLAASFQFGIVGGVVYLCWSQRSRVQCWLAILLMGIAGLILMLTMLRGHQSALIIHTDLDLVGRYLTTPSLYFWTALWVLLAPLMTQQRVALGGSYCVLLLLLWWRAPSLDGEHPLSEAFPHRSKARLLEVYEKRYLAGGQAETVALPGWGLYECMRLKIGGGRDCFDPHDLGCIFGSDLKFLNEKNCEVGWFGRFRLIDKDWVEHEQLGRIAILGYQKGFYWYRDVNGQRYLTGPAMYPRSLEFPPRDMIRLGDFQK